MAALDPQARRQRNGFSIGPANLPDSGHRLKVNVFAQKRRLRLINQSTVQKIKQDLIRKAKAKKYYSKLKE